MFILIILAAFFCLPSAFAMKSSATSLNLASFLRDDATDPDISEVDKDKLAFLSGQIVWFDHSGSETSPRRSTATSESADEELTYTGPALNLRDAVIRRFDRRIAVILSEGHSLQEVDEDKMTIFHHLANKDMHALSTWQTLFLSPRKNVYDFVSKMVEDAVIDKSDMHKTMVDWHFLGLVRVLAMRDKWNRNAWSYAEQCHKEAKWGKLFNPHDKEFKKKYYEDVLNNYKDAYPFKSVIP